MNVINELQSSNGSLETPKDSSKLYLKDVKNFMNLRHAAKNVD
jgi:hypothetical protein